MPNLDEITTQMHEAMKEAHDNKEIRLLNVGSNDPDEYHWRFKAPDGQIFQISIWREDPPGEMRIPTKISGS